MRYRIAILAAGLIAACASPTTPTSTSNAPGPTPQAASPIACAQASYYADSLAGNATASGEPYDPAQLTAAHRTLPFGTKLRVAREGHGEVIVTVNDRGPFVEGRIIDLSRAAAEQVDLIIAGIADVCIYSVD